MKTMNGLFFIIVGICLLSACSKSNMFLGDTALTSVPFKADYIGNYTFVGENSANCGNGICKIIDGKGLDMPGGKSGIHLELCCCTEGYHTANSYIIVNSGDTLHVSCQGQVIDGKLADHPSCVCSYWRDPFIITGGTGQFEGATGDGLAEGYNSSEDPFCHLHWEGTITTVKGTK